MTPWARQTVNALLAAFISPRCAACDEPLHLPVEGPVCRTCWSGVTPPAPPLCRTCGDSLPSWRIIGTADARCPACHRSSVAIDAALAAGIYDGSLRAILHAFKYDSRRSLARPLALAMRRAGGTTLLEGAACTVPVPLHAWRHVARGFNQASLLAAHLGLPVVHALWRVRATTTQSALNAAGRQRNVRGAFRRSPFIGARTHADLLGGRTVVLVDDVSTTGATLDACARVLKEMGVSEVRALTVAKARAHGRQRR